MFQRVGSPAKSAPQLSFFLLLVFLIVLWAVGGGSRADIPSQILTRAAAWILLIIWLLFGSAPRWSSTRVPAMLLGASIILVALQLIPLPPAVWLQFAGRELLQQASSVSGQEQPWRPLSISPGATVNALGSLIVPVTAMIFVAGLRRSQDWQLVPVLLGMILASSVFALLQFSGAYIDFPLINDVTGAVSGNFANRNHFALFAALGCLLTPTWAFGGDRRHAWKGLTAIGLFMLFGLMVLASGSRMGLVLGATGALAGILAVRRELRDELRLLPKRVAMLLVGSVIALVGMAIVLSLTLGRAASVDRALGMDVDQDLRAQALPTLLSMIRTYFPTGAGFGTFDPVYRIHEPDFLLDPQYFNHAHNDWVEIVLDGGLAGALLLALAVTWWLAKSFVAWSSRSHSALERVASGAILLVFLASITDYPARTPLIMAVLAIAAVWLARNGALPGSERAHDAGLASQISAGSRRSRERLRSPKK